MNQERRNKIKKANELLDRVNEIITDVLNEEDMAFNNLSEGLQQTMRGEQMEENINILENVVDSIEEITNNLTEIN